jgi:hypothetical protein
MTFCQSGNIQRPVVADLKVGRSQIAVVGNQQVVCLGAPDIALVVVLHRVLLDAEKTNGI